MLVLLLCVAVMTSRCSFDDLQQWHCSPTAMARNLSTVGSLLQQHLVGAALTSEIYERLQQKWAALQQNSNSSSSRSGGGSAVHQEQQQQQQEGGSALQQQPICRQTCSSSSRWLVPKPPHIPLLKRATEPSMEERFSKAGISLELLNQPGGARLVKL